MFSTIRKRLTYANVAMTFALVFAMSGGAYAAKRYLITSTKQISPKVLTALRGKSGQPGPQGQAGLAGPQGPAGTAGAPGAKGETGAAGAAGKDGAPGKDGVEGSPWTAGGTLPSGKSEYGQWSGFGNAKEGFEFAAITGASFTIPLNEASESVTAARFIGLEEGEGEAHQSSFITNRECSGTSTNPSAAAGHLCVFAAHMANAEPVVPVDPGAITPKFGAIGRTGATLIIESKAAGAVSAWGTWVVTAE